MGYFIALVIPGVILWVIGLPLAVLLILIKNKQSIFRINNEVLATRDHMVQINELQMKYGFYFMGLKLEQFYWEIVIFYTKAILILFSVTL